MALVTQQGTGTKVELTAAQKAWIAQKEKHELRGKLIKAALDLIDAGEDKELQEIASSALKAWEQEFGGARSAPQSAVTYQSVFEAPLRDLLAVKGVTASVSISKKCEELNVKESTIIGWYKAINRIEGDGERRFVITLADGLLSFKSL